MKRFVSVFNLLLLSVVMFCAVVLIPEKGRAQALEAQSFSAEDRIIFAFDKSPWRDVIKWIADAGGMALHYEDLPTGTFSYTDPGDFTHQEAIDRLNLFLLPKGFSLVQSGKLLTVINLSDPRSMQQLESLAPLVTSEQLDTQNPHDVVRCLFTLGALEAEEAIQELQPLELMTQPAVFEKTKRLMITDTVAKLKTVQRILDAFVPSTLDNGTIMRTFDLQHVTAEDILVVARPHLGLATGEMIGIDVSISADLLGDHIFVTGVEDKVKLIETLVTSLDLPGDDMAALDGQMELRAHKVEGDNAEMVYDVLITLLAGKTLRLSVDEDAGTIVALADPQTQAEIAKTVVELQADAPGFEVIPLKSADPFFIITLLEEMLDLPGEYDDPDDYPADVPRIDADPSNRQLFVHAKPKQMEQIKNIISGLDGGGFVGSSGNPSAGGQTLRMLPLRGEQAVEVLETVGKFWPLPNPIFLLPNDTTMEPKERTVQAGVPESELARNVWGDSQPAAPHLTAMKSYAESSTEPIRLLTSAAMQGQAPEIRCQVTPRGVLVQSVDLAALDTLEEQVAMIAGPSSSMPSPPVVFYLKYTKPADALRMLAELLDGGEYAKDAELGSLVNGSVSGGSFLGSIMTSRDGTLTMIFDSITVVADPRLNRLIAQGTSSDVERIESYLKIIDKDKGITTIETYGSAHVVELLYTNAEEVAETLRTAYAGRVASKSSGGAPQPGGQPQPQRGEEDNERKPKKGGQPQASKPEVNTEPQMTIAVHAPSNSLIITAPDQLFTEVEQLIQQIDSRSEETVEVVSEANSALLQSILGNGSSSRRSSPSGSSRGRSTSGRDNRAAIEAFFRREK